MLLQLPRSVFDSVIAAIGLLVFLITFCSISLFRSAVLGVFAVNGLQQLRVLGWTLWSFLGATDLSTAAPTRQLCEVVLGLSVPSADLVLTVSKKSLVQSVFVYTGRCLALRARVHRTWVPFLVCGMLASRSMLLAVFLRKLVPHGMKWTCRCCC